MSHHFDTAIAREDPRLNLNASGFEVKRLRAGPVAGCVV
jgi:hypothetical protein